MSSSFTDTLPDDILVDTAILEMDLTTPGTLEPVGGTRGGIRFVPGKEIRNVEYDGKRAKVVGLDRITSMDPKFTGTLIVFNAKHARALEAGASGTGSVVTPKPAGEMFVEADYRKAAVTWDRGNGGTCTVTFPYCLVTEYEIGGTDNSEGEIPITIEARQNRTDASSSDGEVPYTIVITDPV